MRCQTRIPLGKSGRAETACWEPLNDKGECSIHGPQWVSIVKDTSLQTLVKEPESKRDVILPLAYVASPYSHKDAEVRAAQYQKICEVTKKLALQGKYAVYSPIAHWHPIAVAAGMPTDAQFWKAQNEGIISSAKVVIVAKMDGWQQSVGVEMEIRFANRNKIEVIYVDPEAL